MTGYSGLGFLLQRCRQASFQRTLKCLPGFGRLALTEQHLAEMELHQALLRGEPDGFQKIE